MSLYTPSSPHMHADVSVRQVMLLVIAALLPAIAVSYWILGAGVLIQILLAISVALLTEGIMLALRKRPIYPFVTDGSAMLTAVLLGLSLPPLAPWWVVVIGTAFAIVIVKQLYGGLGYNPFNPAMGGYALLLVSFPAEMTRWVQPTLITDAPMSFIQAITAIFGERESRASIVDAISGATPLDYLKTQIRLDGNADTILSSNSIYGNFAGAGTEWIALAFLAGGCWMIYRRLISWHIPVALLGSIAIISTVFYLIDSRHFAPPLFHLMAGATMLGAFFIATDPVTASTTPMGKIIYGAAIGLLIYVIRVWGGYPDAVAFAVLFMNICAPLIDQYTKPRVFGHERNR